MDYQTLWYFWMLLAGEVQKVWDLHLGQYVRLHCNYFKAMKITFKYRLHSTKIVYIQVVQEFLLRHLSNK